MYFNVYVLPALRVRDVRRRVYGIPRRRIRASLAHKAYHARVPADSYGVASVVVAARAIVHHLLRQCREHSSGHQRRGSRPGADDEYGLHVDGFVGRA